MDNFVRLNAVTFVARVRFLMLLRNRPCRVVGWGGTQIGLLGVLCKDVWGKKHAALVAVAVAQLAPPGLALLRVAAAFPAHAWEQ